MEEVICPNCSAKNNCYLITYLGSEGFICSKCCPDSYKFLETSIDQVLYQLTKCPDGLYVKILQGQGKLPVEVFIEL